MFWLFGSKRLKQLGILGINRRNSEVILEKNPRSLYPLVDEKWVLHQLCERIGIPTPKMHDVIDHHHDLQRLSTTLKDLDDFVIKPARGSSGRGVLIVMGRTDKGFLRPNGKTIHLVEIQYHVGEILSGMFALGGKPDRALIQERVQMHPEFERISYRGIPDVRVLLYQYEPVMAMLRLPTLESNGRANLHQGGIGVGIDLEMGRTHRAIHRNQKVECHCDTGESLIDRKIPFWKVILEMSRIVSRAVGLGFLGVDIVVDPQKGPLLLEANARPGLAIQLANGKGLRPFLDSSR
jgi:alpha-L-glutamate ligase-like protein